MNTTKTLTLWQKIRDSLLFRVFFGIGIPTVIIGGIVFLYNFGNPFLCLFHLATRLYCPGCGSGRALSALLHGELLAALHNNALFVLALPLVAYYLLKQYIRLTFHRDPLPIFSTSWRAYKAVMWVVLVYWVLRNIPVFPFTLLAPLPG